MSSKDFAGELAYYKDRPFPDDILYAYLAQIAYQIHLMQVAWGADQKPFSDFEIDVEKKPKKFASDAEINAAMMAYQQA